ncbi:tRNA (5-methylaminomethyl-2-thiouridine)(34)-methyltransferase MnmD [Parapedobacter sp. DT-150]|uniref:tRNA (5-methylaminomethyl-2-thiouridine)(34)-methyltransferase MnmD n=1 Tax=Parapedobacter sp. DT-150 TaxID=3396162 RepID=UPI003F1BF488
MMEFVTTADGSKTLYHAEIGEHYHSRHGAVQESRHVFLGMGLAHWRASHPSETNVAILEIGFGTGLNFLLSADYSNQQGIALHYTGVEAYPLPEEILKQTGYGEYLPSALWEAFLANYPACLQAPQPILGNCTLEITVSDVRQFTTDRSFDILYFDAFASAHQPEMWTEKTLGHVCQYLKCGGVFVTYAITGHLKRTMKALGFMVEKVPGAPGKREMLRAVKGS